MDLDTVAQNPPQPLRAGRLRRRRTRLACGPCKIRKRKCDGHNPCESCVRYDYDCCYDYQPRRKAAAQGSPPVPVAAQSTSAEVLISPDRQTRSNGTGGKHMEANSGVVFPHVLGLKLSPRNAPKVQGFGWNLGIRRNPHRSEKSITWVLSKDTWHALFGVYVEKIHPMYGFLDVQSVASNAARRWEDPYATNFYDSVLCGVAALGSLFSSSSKANRQEGLLVECAKEILETTGTLMDPSLCDAEGWLLRTLYLRCNSPPHAAWIASCIAMHVIEATGVHQESTGVSLVYSDTATADQNLESRRRVFWIAKLLNTWISFEYGRSRTVLQGVSCQIPAPKPGADPTADLISMFRISESLDPDQTLQASDLEESLARLESYDFTFDALILSQSVLAFTIYRRLQLLSPSLTPTVTDRVIRLGRKGLDASSRCIDADCPWWHVTNVPFQFTCILLAIDTRESLKHIRHSMSTLKRAADHFETHKPRKAFETLELLVRLSQKRKEQDAIILNECFGSIDQQDMRQLDDSPLQAASYNTTEGDAGSDDDLLVNSLDFNPADWDVFVRDPLDFSTTFF